MFKRCVCYIIVITNFSNHIVDPGQDLTAVVEPCPPPIPPPPPPHPGALEFKMTSMKALPCKGNHRKSMGCIFSLISTTRTVQIINTKPRSLCCCVQVSLKSQNIDTWPHYTFIFKIDIHLASLEKTIVMHLIVNSSVFFILFATNKSISNFGMCFLSNQAHRHYCGAYFQVRVLAHIDHTFVSIASLFAAIKFIFLKSKSYTLNRFSLNYIDYIIKKKSLLCFTSSKMRKDGKGGWGLHLHLCTSMLIKLLIVLSKTNLFLSPERKIKNRKLL